MDKEQVLFSLADYPESRLVFDAPKLKAQTTIGDYPVELSRDMSDKKTGAKISRDFGPFELTGSVSRQNKENTALLRAASDRAFIEASRDPYNRALSAGYSDGKFNANFQRSLPNDGGRPSNSLNFGYKTTFADGGPAQQVTQFQPTFSQQGLGSIQQEPYTPAMESTPQYYYSQYAPTQQYGAPTQQYDAPAVNPMTAGLGSYMEGLQYKAPPPSSLNKIPAGQDLLAALTTLHGDQSPKKYTPSAGGNAPGTIMVGGRSWTESDGGKWYANDG
jgi:hypothetical protein